MLLSGPRKSLFLPAVLLSLGGGRVRRTKRAITAISRIACPRWMQLRERNHCPPSIQYRPPPSGGRKGAENAGASCRLPICQSRRICRARARRKNDSPEERVQQSICSRDILILSVSLSCSRATRGVDSPLNLARYEQVNRASTRYRSYPISFRSLFPRRCDRTGTGGGTGDAASRTIAAVKWNNLHSVRTLHPDDAAATPHCVTQRGERRGWVGRSAVSSPPAAGY